MLLDFRRLNRRMHNKSFIADNKIAIVGGRNIGDEYFDAGKVSNFRDLDLLAIGPVVEQASRSFDAYWNDKAAFPSVPIKAAAIRKRRCQCCARSSTSTRAPSSTRITRRR
jgi:putative cardiolipin synthase